MEAKTTHFWTLGTFKRASNFPLPGVTYEQIITKDNPDEYYLSGSEHGGWRVICY
jgi:hypothetical protein